MISNGPIDLAKVLGRFHSAHRDVVAHVRQSAGGTAAHIRDLRDGTLDLAIIALTGQPPAGITGWQVASERLVLICPLGHRYAARRSVTLPEIAGEAFIEFPAGWGSRTAVDQAFSVAGLQRAVHFEVTDYRTAEDMVRNGLGVVFMPATAAEGVTGLPCLAVTGAPLTWKVFVAVAGARRLSAAARALLADLTAASAPSEAAPGWPGAADQPGGNGQPGGTGQPGVAGARG
jgi:DNA-binding transcriptional LysR family regulator